MVPRENGNNDYAKVWSDKQSIMVFLISANLYRKAKGLFSIYDFSLRRINCKITRNVAGFSISSGSSCSKGG